MQVLICGKVLNHELSYMGNQAHPRVAMQWCGPVLRKNPTTFGLLPYTTKIHKWMINSKRTKTKHHPNFTPSKPNQTTPDEKVGLATTTMKKK